MNVVVVFNKKHHLPVMVNLIVCRDDFAKILAGTYPGVTPFAQGFGGGAPE
ncbi:MULTISPECIES: hypothetical protein [unclassified Fibrobacter]|uniref:hypothetical protein n=1 Tax=unclassified Fibrobacter TaxID=2634177 RepID=UPI0013048ACC|nr:MULTISPECIES: hypothetical protein [unclassified Fibrobacter]